MSDSDNRIQRVKEEFREALEHIIHNGFWTPDPLCDYKRCIHVTDVPLSYRPTPNDSWVFITEEEKLKLVNLATNTYMEEWMDYTQDIRLTDPQYDLSAMSTSKTKWVSQNESSELDYIYDSFWRFHKDIQSNFSLQKEQEKREGVVFSDSEIKMWKAINIGRNPKKFTTSEQVLFMWVDKNKNPFYKLLTQEKSLFKKTDRNYARKRLKEIYTQYFESISELKNSSDDTSYILAAEALQKWERTYLYMFAGYLSLLVSERKDDMSIKEATERTECIYYRSIFYSACQYWSRHETSAWVDMVYDFDDIKRLILTDDEAEIQSIADKSIAKRGLLLDMKSYVQYKLLIEKFLPFCFNWSVNIINILEYHLSNITMPNLDMNSLYSVGVSKLQELYSERYPPITEKDRADIANFYRNDYQVIEKHISSGMMSPSQWPNEVFDHIREFLEPYMTGSLKPLRDAVQRNKERAQSKKVCSCPNCGEDNRYAVKCGKTAAGGQRYKCSNCGTTYTHDSIRKRYKDEVKQKAIDMHKEGKSIREIANALKVPPSTVANWVKKA